MTITEPARATSVRLDAVGPGTVDMVGVRLTISALVRWSPLILVAAVLGWTFGTDLPDAGRRVSANATLGLTDDVTWPFYDAVIARQEPMLMSPAVRDEAEAAVGAVADAVTLETETGQTDAVIRIVVESDSASHAIALAQAMAERLVAANLAEQRSAIDERISRLFSEVVEQRALLDELDARRDEERLRRDTDAAEITQARLVVVAGHLTELETELNAANTELTSLGPRVDIVAPAVGGRNRSDDVRSAAVVAALAAMLTIGVIPTLDRRVGRLRSVTQVRRLWPGVPVVDERVGSEILGHDLTAVVDGMAQVYGDVVVMVGDEATGDRVETDGSIEVVVLGQEDVAGSLGTARAVIVAIRRGSVSLRRLDRVADGLAALGIRPVVVVLTS